MPNSFLSSSKSFSHSFSQYTLIKGWAVLPHLSAQGTYVLSSRLRPALLSLMGPPSAASAVMGRPVLAVSNHLTTISPDIETGKPVMTW